MKHFIVSIIAILAIVGSYLLVDSRNKAKNNTYYYILYGNRNNSGERTEDKETIQALNDSLAYVKAFEMFCNSVYRANNNSPYASTPEEFILYNENYTVIPPISESVLNTIEEKVRSARNRYEESKPSNVDYNNSSNGGWKERMETDEYKASLAREIMLKQAGMKDAAEIERAQRNQYLRGGGYDSKDGGKQVHYNGSAQQQRDLDAIDKYMKEHPDF